MGKTPSRTIQRCWSSLAGAILTLRWRRRFGRLKRKRKRALLSRKTYPRTLAQPRLGRSVLTMFPPGIMSGRARRRDTPTNAGVYEKSS